MGQCKGVFTNTTEFTLDPVNSLVAASADGPEGTWLQAPVSVPPGGTTNLAFFGEASGSGIFIKVLYQAQPTEYQLEVVVNNQPPEAPTADVYMNTIPITIATGQAEGTGEDVAAIYDIEPAI